jgi:hypothetical protein
MTPNELHLFFELNPCVICGKGREEKRQEGDRKKQRSSN